MKLPLPDATEPDRKRRKLFSNRPPLYMSPSNMSISHESSSISPKSELSDQLEISQSYLHNSKSSPDSISDPLDSIRSFENSCSFAGQDLCLFPTKTEMESFEMSVYNQYDPFLFSSHMNMEWDIGYHSENDYFSMGMIHDHHGFL